MWLFLADKSHFSMSKFLWHSIAIMPVRGATTAEKLRGTKVWVSTPGRLRSAKGRAGCWMRDGVAPSRCEGPGYQPRKIFENSDAKSCILVTTCCEISYFL